MVGRGNSHKLSFTYTHKIMNIKINRAKHYLVGKVFTAQDGISSTHIKAYTRSLRGRWALDSLSV